MSLYKGMSVQPMEVDIHKLGLDRPNPEFISAGYCTWADQWQGNATLASLYVTIRIF